MFVLQTSVSEVGMQACKRRPQLFMHVACVYCLAISAENFLHRDLDYHVTCTFPNKLLQTEQPLYLPRRATWATFAQMTATIFFK